MSKLEQLPTEHSNTISDAERQQTERDVVRLLKVLCISYQRQQQQNSTNPNNSNNKVTQNNHNKNNSSSY